MLSWFLRESLWPLVFPMSVAAACLFDLPRSAGQDVVKPVTGSQPPAISRWKTVVNDNIMAFKALFKPGCYGARGSEVRQWRNAKFGGTGAKGGEERIVQLQDAIQTYPESPFVDDAALLLARAQYFYRDDANLAIADLYKVVEKYPEGDWIAEDPIVLRDIAGRSVKSIKRWQVDTNAGDETDYQREVFSYVDYVFEHPNRTSDEAKFWIAQIIADENMAQRFQEAENLLRSIVDRHRESGRTQEDLVAAATLKNELIRTELPRTERTALMHLVSFLDWQGKAASAASAAEEYAQLYKGHPSVEYALKQAGRK